MIGFDLKIDGEFEKGNEGVLNYYHCMGCTFGTITTSDGMLTDVLPYGGKITFDNLQPEKLNYSAFEHNITTVYHGQWTANPVFHLNVINDNEPVHFNYEYNGKMTRITFNASDIENIQMIEIPFSRSNLDDINSVIHVIKSPSITI